jgi:hypothetical protein
MQQIGLITEFCALCLRDTPRRIVLKNGFKLKLCIPCESKKRKEYLQTHDIGFV